MTKSRSGANYVQSASELFDDAVKLNNKYNAYEMLGITDPLTSMAAIGKKHAFLKTSLEKEISTASREDAALYQSVIRDYDIASQILSDPAARRKNDLHNGYGEKYLREREHEKMPMHATQAKIGEVRSSLKKVVRSTSGDSIGSTDSENSTRSNSSASSFESLLSSNSGQEIRSTLRRNNVAHVVASTTEEPVVVTSVKDRANALNKTGGKAVIKR